MLKHLTCFQLILLQKEMQIRLKGLQLVVPTGLLLLLKNIPKFLQHLLLMQKIYNNNDCFHRNLMLE